MKGVRSFGKSFSATTKILLPVILSTVALSGHSQAADHLFQPKDEGNLRLSAGIGYAWIRADERVYAEGDRISHLIWKSQTPVISGEIDFRSDTGLTVAARARVGVAGTGKMDDYDWIDDYFKSYRFEDWTHHSHHSVELERYFTGDIAIGYDFVLNDDNTLNLSGGLKYTNIKFNSYGGTFTYSKDGFRDVSGTFPDVPNIFYEQKIPAAFAGLRWSGTFTNIRLTAEARAGATFHARDTDWHWLRPLLFQTRLESAPFLELRAEMQHQLSGQAAIFAAADFERHFEMLGIDRATDMRTNRRDPDSDSVEGAALQSFTVSFGLKVRF
jgi:Outer membrane protease